MAEEKLTIKKLDAKIDTILDAVGTMGTVVEGLVNKDKKSGDIVIPEKEEPKVVEEGGVQAPKTKQLLPEMQEVFLQYFSEEDGFKATYDELESNFTIVVPKEMSNAGSAHWKMYNEDLRGVKVDQNDKVGSVKVWCAKVCQNLKYNKQFKFKQ